MHAISIMMIPELLFFALFTVDKSGSQHSSSFIGLTKTKEPTGVTSLNCNIPNRRNQLSRSLS
jgi:hypothetical protein